ncbi:MAG: F0F1 ATP synthase subunit A [Bacteroidota bacterium]
MSGKKNSLKKAGIVLAILMLMGAGTRFAFASEEHPTTGHDSASSTSHEAHGSHGGSKKFNAGEMILDHVLDAHDWHLWGEGHHAVSIPLPVILYTDKGLDVFMSGAFHHGEATVKGKYNYRLEKGRIIAVDEAGNKDEAATARIKDFSITKNVLALFVSIALMLIIFISVAKAYTRNQGKAPRGLQSLIEPLIVFIRDDVAKANIGPRYEKYLPYLLTAFFFIWINNLLGLIPIFPAGANVTGNISVTLVLALITFIVSLLSSNRHYWRHIFAMPGVPAPVLLILTPIEILGVFIRPMVLMLRLFANITAGHIVVLTFVSLIFIFGEKSVVAGSVVSPFSVLFVVFMSVLELLVAFLQAYVFTLLSSIYIGAALEEGHHEEHH